ncbi:MAG TPA: citrate synthase/methylcitrate synthase [Candidatus Binatia bacterium]|nr:citrate synthase/methylcitrate synthase [Candidatus Binatia bacterium]
MAIDRIVKPGLDGVVVAQTRLSSVDGEAGELIIAGFPVEALANRASFEETVYLLWNDRLPNTEQLADFRKALINRRSIPSLALQVLEAAARQKVSPMDVLRMVAGITDLDETREDDNGMSAAVKLVASFPTIVAAYARMLNQSEPIAPRPDLGHAANYLFMLSGKVPGPEQVRAMETYLNTVVDHGLNASTFTARVIISTQSDLVSAIVGAVGALKGPLHGGAPGPALDLVFEIGEADRAESVLREKFKRGERLMGFGHRVYRVRDPRADVLAAACERLYQTEADMKLYELSRHVERIALRLLDEYKPGRKLQTNVEFYTALLLHGLDLPTDLFTPTFAVSRVGGWLAHCFEQQKQNRLIRPDSEYVGVKNRRLLGSNFLF